jgi:hypothetical protein
VPLRQALTTLLVLVGLLVACPIADAQAPDPGLEPTIPAPSLESRPPGFLLSAGQALRRADRLPQVRAQRVRWHGLQPTVGVPTYTGHPLSWEVRYLAAGRGRVEVHLDGRSGRVLKVWTGPKVDFVLARGEGESVGGPLNAPWIWIPLCVVFLLPFFDPRRPLRLLHLDLVVLLAFGVAQLLFNRGELELWVPLVYPLLGYLLVRMLVAGLRPRPQRGSLMPVLPLGVLAALLVLLVGFRIALNVTDSNVVDVGYASVVGADRITHGLELYTDNEIHGDTYGPLAYLAYVPFEQLFPWRGSWDEVPAAHAAAITFDLLTMLGLFLLGCRLRAGREGRGLGLALAFAWAAYPYSTYVLQSNTNDGLVALLLVGSLLALSSASARGALAGLGTVAKFVSLPLVPLLAAGTGDRSARSLARFGGVFALVVLGTLLAYLPDGGLRELWNTTLGYQLGRWSPFSLWGLHPALGWLQDVVKVAAIGLAVALFFVPRRRDLPQVAALGAAVVLAFELAATHWFFFYLVWSAPLVLVTLFNAYGVGRAADGRMAELSRAVKT